MNLRVLITAGPTQEPLDDVRYISNRSSGRLGTEIARAASAAGWDVTLLLGPVRIPTENPPDGSAPTEGSAPFNSGLRVLRFRTAADLEGLLEARWPENDILIAAAAVSDFRAKGGMHEGKIARSGAGMTLELEPTPDLLKRCVASKTPDQLVVGFGLEPGAGWIEAGRAKLERKGADALVANPLATMESDLIDGVLLLSAELSGRLGWSEARPGRPVRKHEFARWLVGRVQEVWHGRSA